MTDEASPRQRLDELAMQLIARGFRESLRFVVVGRRTKVPVASQTHFIEYSGGTYSRAVQRTGGRTPGVPPDRN